MKKQVSVSFAIISIITALYYSVNTIISVKQVSLFGLSTGAGVLFFPIIYIISDIVSEVYGYRHSRIIGLLAVLSGLFTVLVTGLVGLFPAASTWGFQEAYNTILGNSPLIFLCGSSAMYISDWVNDIVFREFKNRNGKSYFIRSIISSIAGQIVDSIVFFIPVATFIWKVPVSELFMFIVGASALGFILKVVIETALFPINRIIKNKILKYEGA